MGVKDYRWIIAAGGREIDRVKRRRRGSWQIEGRGGGFAAPSVAPASAPPRKRGAQPPLLVRKKHQITQQRLISVTTTTTPPPSFSGRSHTSLTRARTQNLKRERCVWLPPPTPPLACSSLRSQHQLRLLSSSRHPLIARDFAARAHAHIERACGLGARARRRRIRTPFGEAVSHNAGTNDYREKGQQLPPPPRLGS